MALQLHRHQISETKTLNIDFVLHIQNLDTGTIITDNQYSLFHCSMSAWSKAEHQTKQRQVSKF